MTLLTRSSRLFPSFPPDLMNFFNEDRDWGKDWTSKVPAVNITENDQEFNLEVAAPGLEKKDFDLDIENQQLTISSTQQQETETVEEDFTRKEFNYHSFSRSFMLPDAANSDKIKAVYENGVLKVNIPKKEEAKKAPRKQIKVG